MEQERKRNGLLSKEVYKGNPLVVEEKGLYEKIKRSLRFNLSEKAKRVLTC